MPVKKNTRKQILITAGPTREAMDPVRFLTNPSSGKMGLAVAAAFAKRGADVVVVCGPTHEKLPAGVSGVAVESGAEMAAAVKERLPRADVFIATAAVTDWRFASVARHKLKKGRGGRFSVELVRNPDILADAGRFKRRVKPELLLIGFSLETEALQQAALHKLEEKNLDLIIGNSPASFRNEAITALWIERRGLISRFPAMSKTELAERLADWVQEELPAAPLRPGAKAPRRPS